MRNLIYSSRYVISCNTGTTALADTTYYPASASFIDVSKFRECAFLVFCDAVDTAITWQVRQDTSATVTGSVKAVTGATVTGAGADTGKTFLIEFSTSQLDVANSFRYVSLYSTGAAGANDFAKVIFMGWLADEPVSQPSTLVAANYAALP